jgi:hypothetical protein
MGCRSGNQTSSSSLQLQDSVSLGHRRKHISQILSCACTYHRWVSCDHRQFWHSDTVRRLAASHSDASAVHQVRCVMMTLQRRWNEDGDGEDGGEKENGYKTCLGGEEERYR